MKILQPHFSPTCDVVFFDSSAPSGPPTSVRSSSITATSITLQWDEVACLDRNGEVTGYRVHTWTNGWSGTVSVGDFREANISELTPSTEYTVQVAAVNSMGIGPYSSGKTYFTEG